MSALHDMRMPRGLDSGPRLDCGASELKPEPAFAWPARAASSARSGWQAFARRLYRLLTPDRERPWLHNFGHVGQRLSRGAQPGKDGFRALLDLGVATVINLRDEAPEEETLVRDLGMEYLYYPMDPLAAPTHAHVLAFLHTVADPARGHVFFHCYHGADRTGVLAACYRIAHDGWSLEQALAELDRHHFHHAFQQAMLGYLRDFARYWAGLGHAERDRVLHRARVTA